MISKTIATSGGDYTTIAAWEAAIANTDNETGTCTSAAALQTSTLTLNAANTGAYLYLLTADSASRVDEPTAYATIAKARITNNVALSGTGWTIEKVGFGTDTGGFVSNILNISAAATIRRCGFNLVSSTCNDFVTVSANTTIDNCYATGAGTGVVLGNSAGTLNVYHCSIISESGGYAGYYTSGGTHNNYACACQGSGTNWKNDGGTFGGDYNLSQDTTSIGSNRWISQSNIYEYASKSQNYLWLAAFGIVDQEYADDDSYATAPVNYTDILQKTSGTGGAPSANCLIASARRANAASSEDPGDFGTSEVWTARAYTVGIVPSSPSVTPTVQSTSEYALTTAGTSGAITFTQTAGDLVVVFLSLSGSVTVTPESGWTDLSQAGSASFHLFYKVLDGSEGSTFDITISGSEKMTAISYNLSGCKGVPRISTVTSNTEGNALSLSPGASGNLALASASQGDYAVTDYSGSVADVSTDLVGTTRTGTIDVGVWQTPQVANYDGNFLIFM